MMKFSYVRVQRAFQSSSTKRMRSSRAGGPEPPQAAATATAAAVATTATSQKWSWGRRLWTSYSHALEKRPLTTKGTAAALIFFSSDTVTQKIMHPEEDWDGTRASSGAVFGVVASCYLHFWWGFLEATVGSILPVARHRLANTAAKVLIDQGIGAPIYIYSYYIITNAIAKITTANNNTDDENNNNNKSIAQVVQEQEARAREMLWPTMLLHWRLWPLVHSVNFYFVPLQHRVLVQNTVLVGWSGYLSHLNKAGLAPENPDGKLMTPVEEMEITIQRRKTIEAET